MWVFHELEKYKEKKKAFHPDSFKDFHFKF